MRAVDGAIADWWVCSLGGAGFHAVLRCVVGAVEAGPEDGGVGALVEAIGADGIDEDVGGCSGPAPEIGEIACGVCSRCGGTIVLAGDDYIGGSDRAIVRERFRDQLSCLGERAGHAHISGVEGW